MSLRLPKPRFNQLPDASKATTCAKPTTAATTPFSCGSRGGEQGKDYGVEVKQVEGDLFVRITDPDRVHEGVSELLTRLQVIKSTGDAAGAQRIFDEFGTKLDPEWKANIHARRERLKLPKLKAFVFPHLKPVINRDEIVDVKISYDEDLTAQQLRFRRLEHSRELTDD